MKQVEKHTGLKVVEMKKKMTWRELVATMYPELKKPDCRNRRKK